MLLPGGGRGADVISVGAGDVGAVVVGGGAGVGGGGTVGPVVPPDGAVAVLTDSEGEGKREKNKITSETRMTRNVTKQYPVPRKV